MQPLSFRAFWCHTCRPARTGNLDNTDVWQGEPVRVATVALRVFLCFRRKGTQSRHFAATARWDLSCWRVGQGGVTGPLSEQPAPPAPAPRSGGGRGPPQRGSWLPFWRRPAPHAGLASVYDALSLGRVFPHPHPHHVGPHQGLGQTLPCPQVGLLAGICQVEQGGGPHTPGWRWLRAERGPSGSGWPGPPHTSIAGPLSTCVLRALQIIV